MGALHEGHLSLVLFARDYCGADAVALSIFVNPSQFGPQEDFARYPRTPQEDIAMCMRAGVEVVYMPSVEDMYPEGFATGVRVKGVSEGLCAAARPEHFNGVATVVTKLLLRVMPDCAVFGEKDYQQLQVIRRVVSDLDIPASIFGAPTVREPSGLALSSRNRYLTEEEHRIAPLLYKQLTETAQYLRAHPYNVDNALSLMEYNLTHQGFTRVEYVSLRNADTLAPLKHYEAPARLLAAAWLGKTRLIDNIAVE
jgi:pantoate--beta-alanine ligase